jgi:Arc-like DNA binding domain
MQKREKTQIVQLSKVRIPESLRARLEKAARQSGISLNSEIRRRLEASFLFDMEKFAERLLKLEEDMAKQDALGEQLKARGLLK